MKKAITVTLFLLLSLFVDTSSAVEVTLFGPNQYLRTTGTANVYTDTFSAIPGEARLIVKNGDWDGSQRITDAISSASVVVNEEEIFGPNDFNQQIHLLEAPINVAENNSISVELTSNPGSYLTIQVIQEVEPPTITISADPASIMVGESATLTWSSTNTQSATIDQDIGDVPVSGSITVFPTVTTTYTITVTGLAGTATDQALVTVTGGVEPQPEGSFGEQYEDLIPPDATAESYDPKRFSVITGLVQDLAGSPIADVSVDILDHPEYGTAITDAKGRFSIPAEGGGTITVVYEKEGLLTVQRKVYVPWNDIAIAKTIVMIAEDPVSTTVTFNGDPGTVVTHQSTEVTDEFGSRSCTMVFTKDNRAYEVDAQGNVVQELTTITTRATEFTTPESMPAILPPNSAYTYCAELSVDGVQRVRFDKPVITWVDNFLGFEVGEIVPVGYYDRDRGVWVPSDNGVVVKLLDTNADGEVDTLDANGDDQPDDLDGDGSFRDEVTGLDDAGRYQPGSTFCRFEVTRFSPRDCNWPYGPPPGAIPPNPEGELDRDQQRREPGDCEEETGSHVEERSRILHDAIPVPGTDMTLHYVSNRVAGYQTLITIPASGDTVPASLKKIIVRVEIAGRTLQQILAPLPNQKVEFYWDGFDHLGRPVSVTITARVSVGFVYDPFYYSSARDLVRSFAQAGLFLLPIRARDEMTFWKRNNIVVDQMPEARRRGEIGEGWTLSAHHHVSLTDLSTLHKGNGTLVKNNVNIIETVAGNGTYGYSGDGGPATEAQLDWPASVDVDASGNVYIADGDNCRIRKVDTSGIITTVAGNGTPGYTGDGGPATQAQLNYPRGVAVDGPGNLYIVDWYNNVIRKVDTSGIITTVAGNGGYGYSGDGGPATQAQFASPTDVAVDAWGNLYIVDIGNYRIRKVDPGGIITTVAGDGTWGYGGSGDGGPATEAWLDCALGVVVDTSGNLYIVDYDRIRKVDTSGIITTVAGGGNYGYDGDGGPATEAWLRYPRDVTVAASGNLYIVESGNRRIRKVDASGIITTVAGNGTWGYTGDGGPATEASFKWPETVAVDASESIYVGSSGSETVRKVGPPSALAGFMIGGDIPFAEESGIGHIMSGAGRHKMTVDLDTGVILREFGYDQDNNLTSITDRFGDQITIQRDANGVPTSISSPYGLTTNLSIDANNHLTGITYPDGSSYGFEYTSDGLMTAKIEPETNRFQHQFDSLGRLTDATDDEGGHWQFSRSAYANGDILTEVLTGEGNLTSYLDHTYSTGAYTSTITDPTGAQTLFTQSADGLTVNKSLPCGMDLAFKYDVDSEYKFKYVKEMRETTPSTLQKVTVRDKTYQDTNTDDIPDLMTETVAVNGKTTTLENNTMLSRKTITSPEVRTVTTLYNPATLLTTSLTIPGLYQTTYGYDARGRLTSINTNTRQTSFAYDAQGFLESITDPQDHITTYDYDTVGRMTGIYRPDGSSVGFAYDRNGNMTVLTNPSAIDHGFGYNGVNLNASYQTPLSGSYSYVYDKDRRLVQTNFPSGNQINNVYDKTRLIQIQTPEGNIDLSYLCGTKVGSITNGTDTITYGYDGKLVTSETLAGTLNQTLSYGYNNDFNLTSFTYAGDSHIYTYDDDGLLTGADGFTVFRNAENGLPESVTGGALNLSRTFNGYCEVESQDFTVTGRSVSSWSLTRDDNGRITQKTETADGATSNYVYTYDSMGRLLTVTKDSALVEEYQYGLNGTRTYEMNTLRGITGRTFGYSDEDHLLTAGSTTYQYNEDGFLTTKTRGTDMTTYDYSSRGELLSVTLPDGPAIDYVHDPLGRRIAKIVSGVTTEKYLWQGLTRLLAVYDGSDNLIMRFEYADGRMPVAMTKDGVTYYLTYDQVGSLRVLADASGNVVKSVEYDSFGNIIGIGGTDPAFTVPFGFAGGLHDRDTGFVRFGFRDYDPDVGRWTAKDPILFAGGDTDLYGYCLNDPINWVDPLGLLEPGDVIAFGITVMTTTAKVGGLITAGTAQAIGAAATVLGVFAFPSELADEDRILEHHHKMQEIDELERQVEDLHKQLEPMLEKFHIAYDWNDATPCP